MTTDAAPRFRLLTFAPSWGAPSMQPACTKAHAWLLFSGMREGTDFTVEPSAHPSLAGELPVLEVGGAGGELTGPHEMYAALVGRGHDPDRHLDAAQRAESLAFRALIEEHLGLALLYAQWEDEANYDAVTRPALATTLPIPLCYYLPWSLRRRVHSQLARRRCCSEDVAYAMGEAALAALATRLSGSGRDGGAAGGGDGQGSAVHGAEGSAGAPLFFHGATPSSVDASAFAFLTTVLRCPLPHDRLRRAMRAHACLVTYCERIATLYFGPTPPLLEPPAAPAAAHASQPSSSTGYGAAAAVAATAAAQHAAAEGGGKEKRTPKQQAFRRRSRNAVLGAAGAAVLYSLATGALSRADGDGDLSDDE